MWEAGHKEPVQCCCIILPSSQAEPCPLPTSLLCPSATDRLKTGQPNAICTFNFLSSCLFLKRGNGVYFSVLVLLLENFRTRYISKYLSSLRFPVLPVTDRLSKGTKPETQGSDWETVAVKNAGISRLQIFQAFSLGLHLFLLVISSLNNTGEIHLWVYFHSKLVSTRNQ